MKATYMCTIDAHPIHNTQTITSTTSNKGIKSKQVSFYTYKSMDMTMIYILISYIISNTYTRWI